MTTPGVLPPDEQARHLLDPATPLPAPDPGNTALAWALKDLCYAAWMTEPARAARAADVLQALAGAPDGPTADPTVRGLAHWTRAIAELTQARMAAALPELDQAEAALAAAGHADAAAQTQVPKVMALAMLGRHEEAASCGVAAQARLLALGNVRAASRVSMNLGGLQLHRDAYAEAARHYREAAVLFARVGDHAQSVLADIGHASAQSSLGDFDEALRLYARARMRAERHGLTPSLATIEELVALLELARGRFRQALAGLESARRLYEQLGLPLPLATAEKQLGDVYLELRLLPEALRLFDAAMARFGALALPSEQAYTQAQRGRVHALLAQPHQADADLAAAGALFAAQGHEVGQASVALAQAELALAGGDAPAALALASPACTRFRAAGQVDGAARAEVAAAHALRLSGELAAARDRFSQTLAAAEAAQQGQVQLRCLTGLGLVAQAAGDTAGARAAFAAAVERFEDQRRALPDDELRSAFFADHLQMFQALLAAALDDDHPAEALRQLERCRARSLAERLVEVGREAEASDDDAGLRERLNWLYRRVRRLHEAGDSAAEPEAELRRVEQALLEGARRQRLAAAQGEGRAADDDFDPAGLQAALPPGDALVAYGVQGDELFACVVTGDSVRLRRRLASWSAVEQALQSTRFQLQALRHGSTPVSAHLATLTARAQTRLAQMHALVWAPLADLLQGAQRVLIVPHGPLGALPFAALHDGDRPLGQRYVLALTPSAREAWRGLLRGPAPVRRVLAVGEPSQLPQAGREAQAVAARFPGSQALIGPAATVAALRAAVPGVDLLHLACHAQFRTDSPRFSALHLHGEALTADLAEGLALSPCTVVLSACETGLAEQGAGGEMVGLVRAFLVAGAARVVASLWPVDDAITAAFMEAFYDRLQAGEAPSRALQNAQAELATRYLHPYFWGAFVIYGGW